MFKKYEGLVHTFVTPKVIQKCPRM